MVADKHTMRHIIHFFDINILVFVYQKCIKCLLCFSFLESIFSETIFRFIDENNISYLLSTLFESGLRIQTKIVLIIRKHSMKNDNDIFIVGKSNQKTFALPWVWSPVFRIFPMTGLELVHFRYWTYASCKPWLFAPRIGAGSHFGYKLIRNSYKNFGLFMQTYQIFIWKSQTYNQRRHSHDDNIDTHCHFLFVSLLQFTSALW